MSETVARTGCPFSPNTSQNTAVLARGWNSVTPIPSSRFINFSEATPAAPMPERSPLTSARKTGTPIDAKDSAIFCSVTVFPVPVAPVMSPWRLAMAGSRRISFSPDFAMQSSAVMTAP